MLWLFSPAFLVAPLLIFVFTLVKYQIRSAKSPLRALPGPPSQSWFYGNVKQIFERGQSVAWDEWVSTYGKTFRYPVMFNSLSLFTTDPRAINHVLTHSDEFEKPEDVKAVLELLGEGLIFAEGERHRKQRRIMNPAFGPAQLKSFTPIFNQKASEVRNIWLSQLNENNTDVIKVDVPYYMSRTTLDIIGLAGFDYEFNSLQSEGDQLSVAFSSLIPTGSASRIPSRWTIKPVLMAFAPVILKLVRIPLPFTGVKRLRAAKKTIDRICDQLITERKSAMLREQSYGFKEKSDTTGKDLLTLLIRANLQDTDGMSDSDVRAQIGTFLIAGHETTSTAMSWTLFGLCQNLEAQSKLRDELLALVTDDPTMDELKALPYLDMVVRESLRLYSPVFVSRRVAVKNTVLPMRDGSSIRMSEGDRLLIPIYAMNTDRDIWGKDAFEFKPERWESPPEAISENPGVWSNLMTFLGGSRACIGYQFTLIEMKCLLFALVRKFEFRLVLPVEDIVWRNQTVVRRPFVKGAEQDGPKLPLYVKVHVPDA
ncbi:cytochrome P450 [Thelephora ganbajun]|uniref:Cytochrome P450 n=1 Tax=Thelephora ganbajun TaxID=370292 RepID=A0ACB6Z6S7_THEGA|nr:cytochrome P450 [Thelephora ganbajun]